MTQDNTGKKTAGVDGIKSLSPVARLRLVKELKLGSKVSPTRRVWIPKAALISRLNPIIRGWANYYATVVSKKTYSDLDDLTYQKLRAWAKRRHPLKNGGWVAKRYWHSIGGDNWVFATRKEEKTPLRLLNHADTPIVRHVKVKGESSPYDANLVYWSSRMGKHPEISTKEAILLKRQKGKCNHCGLFFRDGDIWEIDHNIPRSKGGKDEYNNLQLLHKHCHDVKTTEDGSVGGSIDSYPSHRGAG